MNWEAIGAIGEIVGAMAVVATLFYLARQTKQNVDLDHAKEQRVIIDQFNVYVRIMMDSDNLPSIRRGFTSYSSLDPDTHAIVWRNFVQWVNYYEQLNYSYQGGLIPKAILDSIEAWVLSMLITPGGSEYWAETGPNHGKDVYEKLSQLLSDTKNLPEPINETYRWLKIDGSE